MPKKKTVGYFNYAQAEGPQRMAEFASTKANGDKVLVNTNIDIAHETLNPNNHQCKFSKLPVLTCFVAKVTAGDMAATFYMKVTKTSAIRLLPSHLLDQPALHEFKRITVHRSVMVAPVSTNIMLMKPAMVQATPATTIDVPVDQPVLSAANRVAQAVDVKPTKKQKKARKAAGKAAQKSLKKLTKKSEKKVAEAKKIDLTKRVPAGQK